MFFDSDMAKFNMKGAQRQQLPGKAFLSWQPGNVDCSTFKLTPLFRVFAFRSFVIRISTFILIFLQFAHAICRGARCMLSLPRM
jgi:hypothetical protein